MFCCPYPTSRFVTCKPAYYDDLLVLTTCITALAGVRLHFRYELRNETGDLLNEAETTLVFVSKASTCQPRTNWSQR